MSLFTLCERGLKISALCGDSLEQMLSVSESSLLSLLSLDSFLLFPEELSSSESLNLLSFLLLFFVLCLFTMPLFDSTKFGLLTASSLWSFSSSELSSSIFLFSSVLVSFSSSELSSILFFFLSILLSLTLQIPESFLPLSLLWSLSAVDSSSSSPSSSSSFMKSDIPLSSESYPPSPRLT